MRGFLVRSFGLLFVLSFAVSTPLEGQTGVNFESSNWFVGYVAHPPRQLLGAGTWMVRPEWRGFGFYLDGRMTVGSKADELLEPPLTPLEAREIGLPIDDESAWTSTNAAIVRAITPEFAVYLGGGVSWETRYLRYQEFTPEISEFGVFWIEDTDQPEVHPNVIGGAFFRMGRRLVVQFGFGTAPQGFTAGGHFLVR